MSVGNKNRLTSTDDASSANGLRDKTFLLYTTKTDG